MAARDGSSQRSDDAAEGERTRRSRRAVARRRLRRQRLLAAAGAAVVLAAALVALLASAGSTGSRHGRLAVAGARHPPPLPDGGPLAPRSAGGLAALWAPQNVVGAQPGSAAAYRAAARRRGLPGDLMIADRGNNRILVVEPSGHAVFEYPSRREGHRLFFDDDTFVEPGGERVIANEEDNHAIVQINLRTRSQKLLFGHPGEAGADRTHVNTPDDAYMLPDGTFTVADADNCRILFVRARRIVRTLGRAEHCVHDPPWRFTPVNGDTPVHGGGILVSEVQGDWIDEIGADGRLRWSAKAPVEYPSDPQPLPGRRVLLADYSSPGHVLIIDHHGRVLWRYGPASGYGRLDHPSLAMALPNGDVAVNDDYRDRVVVIDPRTNRIVWKYGHTDKPGTGFEHLSMPDGMDFIPVTSTGAPDYAAVVHP